MIITKKDTTWNLDNTSSTYPLGENSTYNIMMEFWKNMKIESRGPCIIDLDGAQEPCIGPASCFASNIIKTGITRFSDV